MGEAPNDKDESLPAPSPPLDDGDQVVSDVGDLTALRRLAQLLEDPEFDRMFSRGASWLAKTPPTN